MFGLGTVSIEGWLSFSQKKTFQKRKKKLVQTVLEYGSKYNERLPIVTEHGRYQSHILGKVSY